MRGPGGGYCIARSLDKISVAEIILAVDEPLDATKCGGKANCKANGPCLTHNLWTDLTDQIYSYLESVTLDQLIYGKEDSNVKEIPMRLVPA
ncbi:MAG TPA: Rrf2 family transcriptional regulator [Burkholderiales bacterium]|nr:Rrf2 family transcriptional regulator [Burkholderiales bacterium]